LLYEHYYDKGGIRNPVGLYASVVLALLAMMSKEVAVIYPVFLVTREVLGRNRESVSELASTVAKRTAPFFAVVLVYLSMRYYVLGFLRQDEPKSIGISFLQVLITIPSVLLSYVRMLVAPYPLAVMYDNTYLESPRDARFWAAGLVIMVFRRGRLVDRTQIRDCVARLCVHGRFYCSSPQLEGIQARGIASPRSLPVPPVGRVQHSRSDGV
jgi:hypothetical protein